MERKQIEFLAQTERGRGQAGKSGNKTKLCMRRMGSLIVVCRLLLVQVVQVQAVQDTS